MTDAAFKDGKGAGASVLLSPGMSALGSRTSSFKAAHPLEAEALAIFLGIQWASTLNCPILILSDAQMVINAILNSDYSLWRCSSILRRAAPF